MKISGSNQQASAGGQRSRFYRFSAALVAALVIGGCSAQPMTLDQEFVATGVAGAVGAGSPGPLPLDRFPGGSLAGVTAVPLMLGGHWKHALAADLLLKPVLVEIGATCPTAGLFLLDAEFDRSDTLDSWLERARPQVAATTKGLT